MTTDRRSILKEALQLPVKERAALAGELLESLDDERDEDVEEAWEAELDRRDNDHENFETVTREELKRELEATVKKARGV